MAARKNSRTSKTDHVLSLLAGGSQAPKADAPVQKSQETPKPQEGQTAKAEAAPAQERRVVPPILEVARMDEELSETIREALSENLAQELAQAEDSAPADSPAPDVSAQPEVKAEAAPEPEPQPEPAPKAEPEREEPMPQAEVQAEPAPEPEASFEPEKAPEPENVSEPEASSEMGETPTPEEVAELEKAPEPEKSSETKEAPQPEEAPEPEEAPQPQAIPEERPAPQTAPEQAAPENPPADKAAPAQPAPGYDGPGTVLEDGSVYLNVMELLVEEPLEKYVKLFGLCTCQRCLADVRALALSRLSPKYVVLPASAVKPMLSLYQAKWEATIIAQVIQACKTVMESPRHNL